jgi:hypothetical protein
MMRSILASILILIVAGTGWLTYDWYRDRTGPGSFGAPFVLVDQDGAEITQAAFRSSSMAGWRRWATKARTSARGSSPSTLRATRPS